MNMSPYDLMQQAVDIVESSPHQTNKVAATLAGDDFSISRTNNWPESIRSAIGTDTKIGNSSGTIHAETACILDAPHATEGASLFVTDPPCPNCMKNIVEAGIKTIYIDHKGFNKDFARRRGDDFENMSMVIAAHAGINIYEIHRKEEKIVPIWEAPDDYTPSEEGPVSITIPPSTSTSKEETFPTPISDYVQLKEAEMIGRPFAAAFAKNTKGDTVFISATRHAVIGYSPEMLDRADKKYSFILQPINRLLINAARHGLTIDPSHLFSSITPTSRELINLIGAGFTQLTISDQEKSRDEFGPAALKQLQNAKILTINP